MGRFMGLEGSLLTFGLVDCVARGVRLEFLQAVARTKCERLPAIRRLAGRVPGIDCHSADRILLGCHESHLACRFDATARPSAAELLPSLAVGSEHSVSRSRFLWFTVLPDHLLRDFPGLCSPGLDHLRSRGPLARFHCRILINAYRPGADRRSVGRVRRLDRPRSRIACTRFPDARAVMLV